MARLTKHTFTLVEYGLVMGLVGFLLVGILVLVKPGQSEVAARNEVRKADIAQLEYVLAQKAAYDRVPYLGRESAPTMMMQEGYVQVIVADDTGILCDESARSPWCGAFQVDTSGPHKRCVVNLSGLVPRYLEALPKDPAGGTSHDSGYFLRMMAGGKFEVGSCSPEFK